jgi:dihydropteroate synthase
VKKQMLFQAPLVMGVLNTTPDSFSDGGQYTKLDDAMAQVALMVNAGARIIDVGGESTRPGAERVALDEEQRRVIEVIRNIKSNYKTLVSIDTMNAATAAAAIEAGADIINDVSGGLADAAMFSVAAQSQKHIVISHWRGFSTEMDSLNNYENVARDVANELQERIDAALAAGVTREQIIVDPGLGFAKDAEQNWQLVANLNELEKLGFPILVGASRKRFIASALDEEDPKSVSNGRRDMATAVLTALLLQRSLWGVRVHDVQATTDAIALVSALRNAEAE